MLHRRHHRQRQREPHDEQHLQRDLQPQYRPDAQLLGQQVPDVLRERYAERALVALSREGLLEYPPVRRVHDAALELGPLVEARELGKPRGVAVDLHGRQDVLVAGGRSLPALGLGFSRREHHIAVVHGERAVPAFGRRPRVVVIVP